MKPVDLSDPSVWVVAQDAAERRLAEMTARIAAADGAMEEPLAWSLRNELGVTELRRLYRDLAGRLSRDGLATFRKGALLFHQLVQTERRPFTAHWFNPFAALHARSTPADRGTLLVCFGGRMGAIGVPYAKLFEWLPEDATDVLVLKVPDGSGFKSGVPGLGRTLYEAAANVRRFADVRGYRQISCLGSSLGGMAALRAAILMKADLGLSLGARLDAIGGKVDINVSPEGHDPFCRCTTVPQTTRLELHVGALMRDVNDARRVVAVIPAIRTVHYPDARTHTLWPYLTHEGLYPALIADLVDPSVRTRRLAEAERDEIPVDAMK